MSPNYQQLLDRGDAREVGDILAAGSEATVTKRLQSFADAGVTDVSLRIVPIGDDARRAAGLAPAHPRLPHVTAGLAVNRPTPLTHAGGADHATDTDSSTSRCSTPTTTCTRPRTR